MILLAGTTGMNHDTHFIDGDGIQLIFSPGLH
jgi:hypothetical protein